MPTDPNAVNTKQLYVVPFIGEVNRRDMSGWYFSEIVNIEQALDTKDAVHAFAKISKETDDTLFDAVHAPYWAKKANTSLMVCTYVHFLEQQLQAAHAMLQDKADNDGGGDGSNTATRDAAVAHGAAPQHDRRQIQFMLLQHMRT